MLGIEITAAGSTVVAWSDGGLELIGKGKILRDLVGAAKSRAGVDAESAVVAVPAWYHDGQRAEVRKRVEDAGVARVRLINEPVAVALDYAVSQPRFPRNSLVLSLSQSGVFDVSVLSLAESHVEVLAANGVPELGAPLVAVAERLFSSIEPVVNRALSDAGLRARDLDAIVLAGNTAVLQTIGDRIEAAWGRMPVMPPSASQAVANGAAISGRMRRDSDPNPTSGATPSPDPQTRGGCAGVILLWGVILAALLIAHQALPA